MPGGWPLICSVGAWQFKNTFGIDDIDIGQKRSLIPLNALKALFVCSQVQVAECLMEQALIAKKKLDDMSPDAVDTTFYKGKIACAMYYVNNVLPNAFLATEVIKNEDDTVMTCPEEALVVR